MQTNCPPKLDTTKHICIFQKTFYRNQTHPYSLLRMFFVDLLIGLSLSIRDKKGERDLDENLWEFCLLCLGRVEIVFLKGGEYKNFLLYLT